MKNQFALLLALTLTSCGVAYNRTGDRNKDIFEETRAYIERDYYGFNTDKIAGLAQFRVELENRCSGESNPCPMPIVEKVIEQMVGSLNDPHTYYQNPELVSEPVDYARFGIFLRYYSNSPDVWVSSLEQNSAAQTAGIKRGDRIIAVNGKSFTEYAPNSPRRVLRTFGKSLEPTQITITRANQTLKFTLQGTTLTLARPTLQVLEQKTGLLKIPSFDSGTAQIVHDLVIQAQQQQLEIIILDLRDNLGGKVTETALSEIAFVPRGGFQQEDKSGIADIAYEGACRPSGVGNSSLSRNACWKGKLVVLVNQFSASGAEYTAQLFQDEKRAHIIGEQTYGAGNTVSRGNTLQNRGAISISIARSRRFLDGTYNPAFVTPNTVLFENPERLQQGIDDLLEAALGKVTIALQKPQGITHQKLPISFSVIEN